MRIFTERAELRIVTEGCEVMLTLQANSPEQANAAARKMIEQLQQHGELRLRIAGEIESIEVGQ